MCADKTDKDDPGVVVDFDDEAVVISFNVKDDSVVWQDVRGTIMSFDILRRFPVGIQHFMIPSSQSLLRIRMRLPEIFQGLFRYNAHVGLG